MDAHGFDQMHILTIKKVTSADRWAAARAALAASPSSADLIAAERRARWEAEDATRGLDKFHEMLAGQKRMHEQWLHNTTKNSTERIMQWTLVPTFIVALGTGPLGAVFWSEDYRNFYKFAEGNEFAWTAILAMSFGWASFATWLLGKLLYQPIYDRIIAAKRRQQHP